MPCCRTWSTTHTRGQRVCQASSRNSCQIGSEFHRCRRTGVSHYCVFGASHVWAACSMNVVLSPVIVDEQAATCHDPLLWNYRQTLIVNSVFPHGWTSERPVWNVNRFWDTKTHTKWEIHFILFITFYIKFDEYQYDYNVKLVVWSNKWEGNYHPTLQYNRAF